MSFKYEMRCGLQILNTVNGNIHKHFRINSIINLKLYYFINLII